MRLQIISDLHLETGTSSRSLRRRQRWCSRATSTAAGRDSSAFAAGRCPSSSPGTTSSTSADDDAWPALARVATTWLPLLERGAVFTGADGRRIRTGTTRWCDFALFGDPQRARAARSQLLHAHPALHPARRALRCVGRASGSARLPRMARVRAGAHRRRLGCHCCRDALRPELSQRRPALRRSARHRELLQRRRRPVAARGPRSTGTCTAATTTA